jgi:hypothetical protein
MFCKFFDVANLHQFCHSEERSDVGIRFPKDADTDCRVGPLGLLAMTVTNFPKGAFP